MSEPIDCPCTVWLADDAATTQVGLRLAAVLPSDATVYLQGDLGAGKTSLVRAILRALGETGPVPSPTYTLVEIYPLADRKVQHFDLYRLADPEEFEYIGGHDLTREEALRFIEWPERGVGEVPAPDVVFTLSISGAGRLLVANMASEASRIKICKALN
jgi:tRNA threonylcarbamoyladenosine biosynthesis protein TsaE